MKITDKKGKPTDRAHATVLVKTCCEYDNLAPNPKAKTPSAGGRDKITQRILSRAGGW